MEYSTHVIARAQPVAISWTHVPKPMQYQEIATPSARKDSDGRQMVLRFGLGSRPG